MTESLFSQSWYRVADLKIRLRQHAVIHRHTYRDKLTYILQDHVTGQFHRFTPEAYQIIGLMDGEKTLQQIWEIACEKLGDDMPTQSEVITLVAKLNRANVIQSDILPDIEDLHSRHHEFERRRLLQQFKSPLSIRIPLLDPENFLRKTMPLVSPLIGFGGALLWITVVIYGFIQLVVHWEVLTSNIGDRVLALENLVLIAMTYPVVKAIHELGHAYCVKKWNGEVHEIGIMFLVFFPVPYVDATAASAFPSKYHRMLVGAAGILVEAFLAALAMIIWTYVEQGAVRALMFNVMLISGFSTLLFNGNPLLRFDAYYVLADYLEMPNLGIRGNNYIGYLVKRYLFGVEELISPAASKSEAFWLAGYALASFIYRIFITIGISLFVGSKYFVFGTIICLWFIYLMIVSPMIKVISKPMTDPQLINKRSRVFFISSALLTLLVAFLFFLPLPLATRAEGIIWVSDQAYIRSEVNGFISRIAVNSNEYVTSGNVLVDMENPQLDAKVDLLDAQVRESEARYQASLEDKVASEIIREEYRYILQEYQRELERQSKLQIKAKHSGTLVIYDHNNMLGRFISRGEMLGYVVDYNNLPVMVMVKEDDIDQVRNDTLSVELRFVSNPDEVFTGKIRRIVPSSTRNLISPVLSINGGGNIALDPNAENQDQTFEPYFQIEIDVPEAVPTRIEERIHVLFKHEPEPIAKRWYRVIRRVFLRQFNV